MAKDTFDSILASGQTLYYKNVGDSMMPLIKEGRDILIIEPKPKDRRLQVNDIPLYRRDNGAWVLHRIVAVYENDYGIRGDNRWGQERGISDRHIHGILTGIVTNGELKPLQGDWYNRYLRTLRWTYPFRWLKWFVFRLKRKLKLI